MKLIQMHIQNYRSIVDSGEVNIEKDSTILIGKNEQGKTNTLKALKSFNKEEKYAQKDLPLHLLVELEKKQPSGIPIITLWFEIGPDDIENLKDIIAQVKEVKQLKVTRFYDGNYKSFAIYEEGREKETKFSKLDITEQTENIKKAAEELKARLTQHCTRFPAFASAKGQFEKIIGDFIGANYSETSQIDDLIKTFIVAIKSLPSQDDPIKADIANTEKSLGELNNAIKTILSTDALSMFIEKMPRFVLHSSLEHKIPDSVPINDFVNEPEKVSKSMLHLCRVAGLSMQKLRELSPKPPHEKTSHENYYRGTVSGNINKIWTQEQYKVHFRIEEKVLAVSISDETYPEQVPPSERSDGFQWFLSFYTMQSGVSNRNSVILLDNPALELHMNGQRDIKDFLEKDIVSPTTQLIYATHSPGMVDPFRIEQVRAVELRTDNEGTKIHNKIPRQDGSLDILQSLRAFIGSSVAYSLICNKYNMLVEGDSDKYIYEGFIEKLKPGMCNRVSINGRLAEEEQCSLSRYFLSEGLNFICLVDGDESARRIKARLKKNGIPEDKIISLADLFDKKGFDFDVEDLIDENLYYKAVQKAYSNVVLRPVKDIVQLDSKKSKITKKYEKEFKTRVEKVQFNKTPVALALKEILKKEKIEEDTSKNFDKIFECAFDKLGCSQTIPTE